MKVDPAAILAVALFLAGMAGMAIAHAEMTDGGSDTDSIEREIVSQTEGQTLYRLDLRGGPLYYYECDTENGTMAGIVGQTDRMDTEEGNIR